MGIQNRDYYREENTGSFFGPSGSGPRQGLTAVGWIIWITAGFFAGQMLIPELTTWFWLSLNGIQSGKLWTLVTYAFLHDRGSLLHIIINMLIFYMIAPDLLHRRGPRELVTVYLASAAFSGLAFLVWAAITGSNIPVVGASGAVNAFVVIFALANPHTKLYLFGLIPMQGVGLVILKIAFDLLPMVLNAQPFGKDVLIAHSAHLGGILFGVLYHLGNWNLTSRWSGGGLPDFRKMLRRKPNLKVHHPPVEDAPDDSRFARRVDALLEKVAQQGEASLTDEERAVLIEASRRARERMSR